MHVHDSLVIGAGQAGLSASHHLQRLGIEHVVLDASPEPGGAWQHRWDSLTMDDVHGVADLPDAPAPGRGHDRANVVIPGWFGDYERRFDLPVLRPVRVDRVDSDGDLLVVHAGGSTWRTRTLVNATGTWSRPFVPEIRPVAETIWVTRREPVWNDAISEFDGRAAIAQVEERVRRGLPPRSVVSVTGLALRPQERLAESLGAYERRPMFARIEPDGVRWAAPSTGSGQAAFERVDAILWATGFRPAVAHLAPLHLTTEYGGIRLLTSTRDVQSATTAADDPRVQLVGYGPSASTIGGNRAGRAAATAVRRALLSSHPPRESAAAG